MAIIPDIIVVSILALFVILGYRRGLIKTAFRMVSFVLSIFLSIQFYPVVAQWLRGTGLYPGLQGYIVRTMNLGELTQPSAVFDALPLPNLLRTSLETHYSATMQNAAESIEAFIAGYFAGLAINVLALILVFVLVRAALGIASMALDIVARLPIIATFNRLGGLLVGVIQGVAVVWVGMTVLSLFFLNPTNPGLQAQLDASFVASWFFENNLIMEILADIG